MSLLKINGRLRVTFSLISNGCKLMCGITQSVERIVNGLKVLGSDNGGEGISRAGIERVSFSGQKNSARDVVLTNITPMVAISS